MEIEIKQFTQNYVDILYLAGRGCYGLESLNNETHQDKLNFIRKLIDNQHESVLEHSIISIHIIGCSRSFMSQITRHRMASYSIKSQHYVNHSDFKVKDLESDDYNVNMIYSDVIDIIRINYRKLVENFKIPIYIAREILPNACLTNIFMTANFREWRYIIQLRQTNKNTPEMRKFATIIKRKFQTIIPGVFDNL